MFVRRQAFATATRLSSTASRAIVPCLRYSTESAAETPTTPPAPPTPSTTYAKPAPPNPFKANGEPWKPKTPSATEPATNSADSTSSTSPAAAPTDAAAKPAASTTTAKSNAPAKVKAKAPKAPPPKATPKPAVSRTTISRPTLGEDQVPVIARYTPKSIATAPSAASKPGADFSHATFDAPASVNQSEAVDSVGDLNWEKSYYGASVQPVTAEQFEILMRPIALTDIEVKPDGVIYLPEIKYRRKLNEAFGPMGWCLIPRGEAAIGDSIVTREYALIVNGRFVSQSQGENNYFGADQLPSAVEGCKSNALMRCCKDLGIASELWDPNYIRWFKKTLMKEVWVEHQVTKKKRTLWFHASSVDVQYPWKLSK